MKSMILDTNSFNKEEMAKKVLEWANINSGTSNILGLERLSVLLTHAFHALDCEGKVYHLPPIASFNAEGIPEKQEFGPLLSFWKRKEAPFQVLLVGHMDTVYDADHPFQRAFRQDEKIIRGPGVTDMKGGLCVMLEALKAFEKTEHAAKLGWEVLINPDEEIGSLASAPFLEERARKKQVGLVFEPAMDEKGTLAGNRKGSGKFIVRVEGRAAHAGRNFQQGRNAIVALAKIIRDIDDLNKQQKGSTLNIGRVFGGGALNIVPAHAITGIDVRFEEASNAQWIKEQLDDIVQRFNEQEGYKVTLEGSFNRTPKKISGDTQKLYELVVDIGKSLGQHLTWQDSGGCSDGNNLSVAGLPNVDSLGVCGGKIHSSDEYMLVDSLEQRAQLTLALLIHFCITYHHHVTLYRFFESRDS